MSYVFTMSSRPHITGAGSLLRPFSPPWGGLRYASAASFANVRCKEQE